MIKRDQIEYSKTFLIVQAIVNAEKVDEALKEYRDLLFPYFQKMQKSQRESHLKQLMEEVKRGGISVTPVAQKKIRSRLKTKVLERTPDEHVEIARRLAKRVGGYI